MDLKEIFKKIFQNITNQDLNYSKNKELYTSILNYLKIYFPIWSKIIQSNFSTDEIETSRTIEHIFRLLKILNDFLEDKIDLDISESIIHSIKNEIKDILNEYPNILFLLILYHDIGRPINKEWHTFKSAEIIKEKQLLKRFNLSSLQEKFLIGIVKNHLLLGTIFTGESSYTGAISLAQDPYLNPLWESKNKYISLFFKIMKIFTIIDILGYSYSKIYDHYYKYYSGISETLEKLFISVKSIEKERKLDFIYANLKKIDESYLKWRLSGSLRIFQFIGTIGYLTEAFFYKKIKESLRLQNIGLKEFKTQMLKHHHLVQFKYALGIMMILANDNIFSKIQRYYSLF
jgi:hypothetical protein